MAGNFEDGSYQKVIYVEQNSPFEYLEIPTMVVDYLMVGMIMKQVIMWKKELLLLKI